MVNSQNLLVQNKVCEPFGLQNNVVTYGLMGIAFCLFFVLLNHIVEYVFFLLLFVWIIGQLKNGTLKWVKTSLDLPIFLYVAWILICVPFAVDPAYSFSEWRKVVAHILLFYFVVQTIKTQEQTYSIILTCAAGVTILCLIESIYFFGQGRSLLDMKVRGGELTGSSQWLSVYVVMGLPLVWWNYGFMDAQSKWIRIGLGGAMAITTLGLFLSHTRGAWIAVGIQIFVYCCLKRGKSWWIAFGGGAFLVCSLLVVLFVPGPHHDVLGQSGFTSSVSMFSRLNTWSLALQDIAENPFTGIGIGKHSFSKLHLDLGSGFHANLHNTFLGRAVQIGIPGFLFFIWIFIVVVARAGNFFQRFPNEVAGKLAGAISLIVVGVIVRNIFDDMFNGTVAYLFYFLVGCFFSLENSTKDPKSMGIA